MGKDKVYSRLPKAGLGNKMLVWARGCVFAYKNNLELFTSAWWSVQLGPWIRREKQKRLYWGYFNEDSLFAKLKYYFFRFICEVEVEPRVFDAKSQKRKLYVFNSLIHSEDNDYFKELKPYRQHIKNELYKRINPALLQQLDKYSTPAIGIHVRRGDFKLGSKVTPISFFVDAINSVRSVSGKILPVTIFTDASKDEIEDLLSLPCVDVAVPKQDILDILLLSKSDICILSINSTFSSWAAFLNDGIILKHPEEWNPDIRPGTVNNIHYEGYFDPSKKMDESLKAQIIKCAHLKEEPAVKNSTEFSM